MDRYVVPVTERMQMVSSITGNLFAPDAWKKETEQKVTQKKRGRSA
jgi:hypothetical protein